MPINSLTDYASYVSFSQIAYAVLIVSFVMINLLLLLIVISTAIDLLVGNPLNFTLKRIFAPAANKNPRRKYSGTRRFNARKAK